jgi:hypothetical protein
MRLVLYTVVTAKYDRLRPIARPTDGVKYVCFSDDGHEAPDGWTAARSPHPEFDAVSRSRWAKFHPHLLFPDSDASIYVDGNFEVIGDISVLAERALRAGPIAFYEHPFRTSQREEAKECARAGLEWLWRIRRQLRRQRAEGFEDGAGLLEGGIIVRAHHHPAVIRVMNRWWSEWQIGAKRDQLALMYSLWKEGVAAHSMGRNDGRFDHEFFIFHVRRRATDRSASRALKMLINRIGLAIGGI